MGNYGNIHTRPRHLVGPFSRPSRLAPDLLARIPGASSHALSSGVLESRVRRETATAKPPHFF